MSQKNNSKRLHDFEVKYRFLSAVEGGRKTGSPFQGYRSDWAYEGDDISKTGIYMIHPEFLDNNGNVLDKDVQVPISGIARMRILSEEMKGIIHRKRIKVGVKGYFMEGGRRVAEAEVTKVVGLKENKI